MPKVIAQNIKDLGFTAEMYNSVVPAADSEVVVDGVNYSCIAPHVSADINKPGSGASWQTYWLPQGYKGIDWAAAQTYTANFKAFIDNIILDKSDELTGRIGTTAYTSAIDPNPRYVKNAELYLCAAEMCQRRINVIVQDKVSGGDNKDATYDLRQQLQRYLDQAEMWIQKVVIGSPPDSSDFACGALITRHSHGYR